MVAKFHMAVILHYPTNMATMLKGKKNIIAVHNMVNYILTLLLDHAIINYIDDVTKWAAVQTK